MTAWAKEVQKNWEKNAGRTARYFEAGYYFAVCKNCGKCHCITLPDFPGFLAKER